MIDLIWPLVRIVQFVLYIPVVIKNVKNWRDYYLDMFFPNQRSDFWVMEAGAIKIKLRSGSADRWIAFENLVLEKNNIKAISNEEIDTIIDLGANIGASVINFHQHFPKAKIVAIEPNSSNISLLRENLKLNRIEQSVSIVRAAVSGSDKEKAKLYINKNDGESSLVKQLDGAVEVVDNLSFNKLAELVKGKTLLKMDIQGEEYELFDITYFDLLKKFDFIMVESHIFSKERNPKVILKFLNEHGFNFYNKGKYFLIYL